MIEKKIKKKFIRKYVGKSKQLKYKSKRALYKSWRCCRHALTRFC